MYLFVLRHITTSAAVRGKGSSALCVFDVRDGIVVTMIKEDEPRVRRRELQPPPPLLLMNNHSARNLYDKETANPWNFDEWPSDVEAQHPYEDPYHPGVLIGSVSFLLFNWGDCTVLGVGSCGCL